MIWCKIHCRKQVCFPVTCRDRSWSMELETRIRDLSQTFHDFFSVPPTFHTIVVIILNPNAFGYSWIWSRLWAMSKKEESSEKTTRNWSEVMVQRKKDQPTNAKVSRSLIISPLQSSRPDDLRVCLLWGPMPPFPSDCISQPAPSYHLPLSHPVKRVQDGYFQRYARTAMLQLKPNYCDLRHNLREYDMPSNCLQRPKLASRMPHAPWHTQSRLMLGRHASTIHTIGAHAA